MRSESDPGIADGQVAAISSTDPTPETISGLAEAFKPPPDPTEGGLGSPAVSLPNLPHNTQPHSLTDTQVTRNLGFFSFQRYLCFLKTITTNNDCRFQ